MGLWYLLILCLWSFLSGKVECLIVIEWNKVALCSVAEKVTYIFDTHILNLGYYKKHKITLLRYYGISKEDLL
jgi:hypothetical protein